MWDSDNVVQPAFDALFRWSGYQILSKALDETPDLRVYLAGGVIRDCFLGCVDRPKDFDFFLVGASQDQVLATLQSYGSMRTGPFGAPRWYPRGDQESYCDLISIERFYNGLWRCEDIVDALNQSDFTGNAVAIDLRNGKLYDPQNGRRDMQRRMMRMVRFDYPDEPIGQGQSLSRQTVLWFRVLYYARALDLTIEPITRKWLISNRRFWEHVDSFAATFFPVHATYEDVLTKATNE